MTIELKKIYAVIPIETYNILKDKNIFFSNWDNFINESILEKLERENLWPLQFLNNWRMINLDSYY